MSELGWRGVTGGGVWGFSPVWSFDGGCVTPLALESQWVVIFDFGTGGCRIQRGLALK
jgi:hypothetical protein